MLNRCEPHATIKNKTLNHLTCPISARMNVKRKSYWGALHLLNAMESGRSDSSYTLLRSVAVYSLNQTVVTRTCSGDGALPNR